MPRSSLVVLSVLVLGAVCVPSAAGQGMYEPFPQPKGASRAQSYAARLGVSATKPELRRGVFVGKTLPRTPAGSSPAASGRAGLEASTAGLGALLLAVLAGLLTITATRLRPHARPAG